MTANMQTIAVTVDTETLEAIDRLGGSGAKPRRGRPRANRSAVVRVALRRYVEARSREASEDRERRIFARHRDKLARQAKALVAEQAAP